MKFSALLVRFTLVLAVLSLSFYPLGAQQRRPAPQRTPAQTTSPPEPVATFDGLLAADIYRVYGEVRGVGQLIQSVDIIDVIGPLLKFTNPPKEFTTMFNWVSGHADDLATARMLFAAWPSKPKLPEVLVAIELSSPEEARRFEPQLRTFLGELLAPPTTESPSAQTRRPARTAPTTTRFQVRRSGSLIILSDSPINLRNLKPEGSQLLAEDQNFRIARDRFASDSIFFYFDIAPEDLMVTRPVPPGSSEPAVNVISNPPQEEAPETDFTPPPPPAPIVVDSVQEPSPAPSPTPQQPLNLPLVTLFGGVFGGPPHWPEAVGATITFDGASYVLKALLVNGVNSKIRVIPFIPGLIAGPAQTFESPSIMPADIELLVATSVEYKEIYEAAINFSVLNRQQVRSAEPDTPFASFEKEFGISIKDELLPLLGNEIAVSVPIKSVLGTPPRALNQKDDEKAETLGSTSAEPIVALAINDREAMKALLTRMMNNAGLKGAGLLAQIDKRDDTELVSYGDLFSYAFIGNFLVGSPDPASVRRVVESYRNHQTLASDSSFRNYSRWQPRQVLGQIYVSPALMESYSSLAISLSGNEKVTDFLNRVSLIPEPVTYAVSSESMGPLHELHIPKSLVMLAIATIIAK